MTLNLLRLIDYLQAEQKNIRKILIILFKTNRVFSLLKPAKPYSQSVKRSSYFSVSSASRQTSGDRCSYLIIMF